MKVLITGGAGFLGQRLARELLVRGTVKDEHGKPQAITELVLL
ncbi:MAG: NAD-dependent epimerase, partial [Paraburkholderia nemoris]